MISQPINLQKLARLLILKTQWSCPMWIFPLWLFICLAFCLQVVLRRLSRRRKSRESAFVTTLRVYDSGIRVKSKPKRKLDRVTQSFTHIFNHNNRDPANGPELEYEVSTVYTNTRKQRTTEGWVKVSSIRNDFSVVKISHSHARDSMNCHVVQSVNGR